MTGSLDLHRDGWLNTSEDDDESRAVTRLRISVDSSLISRNISKRGGMESEAINISLLPLANFLAKSWWPLLYEPLRPSLSASFRIRHRLDSGVRGYAFPSLALWSGGDHTTVIDWASFENPYATISFVASTPDEPVQLDRDLVEFAFIDLIEAVLERIKGDRGQGRELVDAWERVRCSIADPDEFNYCTTAGRLGLDPYDPETPDLSVWAQGISEKLFADLSEAVELEELGQASAWLRETEPRLQVFPEISLASFGVPVADDLNAPAWAAGEASAFALRRSTGLSSESPRRTLDELLGATIAAGGEIANRGPDSVTALVRRLDHSARIGTIARSARQRRFRACAGTYMAWTAGVGEDRAATEAFTRRQQASRAFAAEMLAPKDALIARAPRNGFDGDDLDEIASEFVCPYTTVMWQALRAGIALRGVELPPVQRPQVVTAKPAA